MKYVLMALVMGVYTPVAEFDNPVACNETLLTRYIDQLDKYGCHNVSATTGERITDSAPVRRITGWDNVRQDPVYTFRMFYPDWTR